MYWVLLVAAGAILGGVVVVAMGRGGEMAAFSRDLPISATNPRTPMEVATQRLPLGPLGYQPEATEEALLTAASLLHERDQEIVALRSEIRRLGGDPSVRPDQAPPVYVITEIGENPGGRSLPAGEPTSEAQASTELPWPQ